ncbi:Peptidyl-prolyl cis-trans isomerase 9 [Frankliniella fusca]|uniref:Peptidyl-prolyl cis-trans isomerase 9 n=1 Tax=Frankliniella fusca TaxID=407009 RepID=A0AAE1H5Z6_9NEOP|nr:Peptidyl-prolyl cis-trans isomerase 9 [Frankliniella fusca]
MIVKEQRTMGDSGKKRKCWQTAVTDRARPAFPAATPQQPESAIVSTAGTIKGHFSCRSGNESLARSMTEGAHPQLTTAASASSLTSAHGQRLLGPFFANEGGGMLKRPRTKGSPRPATSEKKSVRSYLLEPKYITNLVVKGQGGPKPRYTKTQATDLHKAARVHYFPTEPVNKVVEMKLDVRNRIAHSQRVMNPQKKIDNAAPRLFPRVPRTERAAFRLDDVMLENKRLLERICTIWRTRGIVDTSAPNVEWKSNLRQRVWDTVRREADNVALLYFIQTASPLVPTRDECARDFQKAVYEMKFMSKFPLQFLKDINKDLPLPMPDPPPVDLDAPPRRRVFFEFITSQERLLGRVELELFEEEAPQTVANFLAHVRGEAVRDAPEAGEGEEQPGTYSYRDTPLHRILPGYYILGGDVVLGNGSAGNSIHGGAPFPDEKNDLTHCEPGLLCTIGARPDNNDSRFMITMKALPTLDGSSTVFGRVVKGFDVLQAIDALGARASGKPVVQVLCCSCGDVAAAPSSRSPRSPRTPRRRKGAAAAVGAAGAGEGAPVTPQRRQRRQRHRLHLASTRSFSSTRISVASGGGTSFNRSPYASPRGLRAAAAFKSYEEQGRAAYRKPHSARK